MVFYRLQAQFIQLRHFSKISNINTSRNYENWTSEKVRSSFLSFFNSKGHDFVPSSSVVPWNDNSIEYVNAGMNQFKSIFLGEKQSSIKAAVNSQKCIRAGGKHNDLADVGLDTYHHTFFEMLGNWSFQSFFKKQACEMSWELLTKVYKIPVEHLYVTYFGGDDSLNLPIDEEIYHIWRSIGVPEHRIISFGYKDNFWDMGTSGPCGPCTEIHYERTPSYNGAVKVNTGNEDLIELWNLVFIQHQRLKSGELIPLEGHFVDTGMGLERLTACLNGKSSNYDTDLFIPLFDIVQKLSGKAAYAGTFSGNEQCQDMFYRILADHIRMATVSLADGLLPHDSYILRKMIRRCLLIGQNEFGLGNRVGWLSEISREVSNILGPTYPELFRNMSSVKCLLDYEELLFKEVQSKSKSEWQRLKTHYPRLSSMTDLSLNAIEALDDILPSVYSQVATNNEFPALEAFNLSCKYKLSMDQVRDISQAMNLSLDCEVFEKLVLEHRQKLFLSSSEKVSLKKLASSTDDSFKYEYRLSNSYDYDSHQTSVSSIISSDESVQLATKGQIISLILPSTNFYSRAGGQSCDQGIIEGKTGIMKVNSVQTIGDLVVHTGLVESGSFKNGDKVALTINKGHRLNNSRHHSVHHLLMSAIRYVNGMAYQRSTSVNPDKMSLDVFCHTPLSLQQIINAELIVQFWIKEGKKISRETKDIFSALIDDRPHLVSSEKYPNEVHVVRSECELPSNLRVDDVARVDSCELCCGTHLLNTAHLNDFAIIDIDYRGFGVTRIIGTCGKSATNRNTKGAAYLAQIGQWETKVETALHQDLRVRHLSNELKTWKKSFKKSLMSFTAYKSIIARYDRLVLSLDAVLITASNWKQLFDELQDLRSFNVSTIIHHMTHDFRGKQSDLEKVVQEVDNQSVAFTCKGWGKVRACVFVLNGENSGKLSEALSLEMQSTYEKAVVKCRQLDRGWILTFQLNGVKVNDVEFLQQQLIEIITKHLT